MGISHIDTPPNREGVNMGGGGDDVLMFPLLLARLSLSCRCVDRPLIILGTGWIERDSIVVWLYYQHMYTWFPAAAMNFSLTLKHVRVSLYSRLLLGRFY
jgi:hypothetical protein